MSITVMTRVWRKSIEKGSHLLLSVALADNANESGFGYPGIAYLKDKIRMSERETQRLIGQLADHGEIYREVRPGRGVKSPYVMLAGLDRAGIEKTLTENASELDIDMSAIPNLAQSLYEKRCQYVTFLKEQKQARKERRKSVKKVTKQPEKGDIVERKTPITVEPSLSNTDSSFTNVHEESSQAAAIASLADEVDASLQDDPIYQRTTVLAAQHRLEQQSNLPGLQEVEGSITPPPSTPLAGASPAPTSGLGTDYAVLPELSGYQRWVIAGIEHYQIASARSPRAKMYCGCSSIYSELPDAYYRGEMRRAEACPVCSVYAKKKQVKAAKLAAERATPKAKTPRKERKPDPVFDAIALGSFNLAAVKGKVGSRIGGIAAAVKDCTPDEHKAMLGEDLPKAYLWWKAKGLTAPRDALKLCAMLAEWRQVQVALLVKDATANGWQYVERTTLDGATKMEWVHA